MKGNFKLIVLLVVLVSCGRRDELNEVMMPQIPGGQFNFDASAARNTSQASLTIDRKLIKNASLEFEVSDINTAKKSINDFVLEAGGYISSDAQNNYSGTPRYEQTVRIPVEKLDEFISRIESLARNVDSKNINVQDVTEEFIDVETRLNTKKQLEARYLELLKQSKTVKDLIEVETQLANVRAEIESMEGRLKYLNSQVSLSTVNLSYYQPVSGNTGFGYRLSRTFGNGWDNFLGFVIGVFEAWPFIIVVALLIFFFIRWRRKRNQAS